MVSDSCFSLFFGTFDIRIAENGFIGKINMHKDKWPMTVNIKKY